MHTPDEEYGNAHYYEEQELETLAALARCATAGGNSDDLQFLAAQLGLGARWKAHASAPTN